MVKQLLVVESSLQLGFWSPGSQMVYWIRFFFCNTFYSWKHAKKRNALFQSTHLEPMNVDSPTQVCPGHILGKAGVEQGNQAEVTPALLPPQAWRGWPRGAWQGVLQRTHTVRRVYLHLGVEFLYHKPFSFGGNYFFLKCWETLWSSFKEFISSWEEIHTHLHQNCIS
jgi:hypothetical protein